MAMLRNATTLVWLSVVAVVATLAVGPAVGAQSTDRLFGFLDEVVATDPGRIMVRGWVVDPGDADARVDVVVSVLGPDGVTTSYDTGPAKRFRNDVGRVVFPAEPGGDTLCQIYCGQRDYHGFAVALTGQLPGVSQVCVDGRLGAVVTRVGCDLVRVAYPSRHDPTGRVEVVALPGPQVRVTGWVYDVDSDAPVLVHVYVLTSAQWDSPYLGIDQDGCHSSPNSCVTSRAGWPFTGGRDVVADADPAPGLDGPGGHGLRVDVAAADFVRGPGVPLDAPLPATVRVCALAENVGPGRDALLGCSWLALSASAPTT